jgi:hypothetical protein
MPFLSCQDCHATMYVRTGSAPATRSCARCGAALGDPVRRLSATQLRMRRKAKLPSRLLESSDSRLRTS